MSRNNLSYNSLKNTALGLGVLCFILVFVAVERYQANAATVAAANQMLRSSPALALNTPFGLNVSVGPGQPVAEIAPGVPAITEYAALFAFLSGAGALACLVKSRS